MMTEQELWQKQIDALAVVVQRELASMNNVKLDLISRMEKIEARLAKLETHLPQSTKWY